MKLLALLILSIVPRPDTPSETVDLIEINWFFGHQGELIFSQAIFWDWRHDRYEVRAWRLVKEPGQLPVRDWQHGGYVTAWKDEGLRRVRATEVRETFTQVDVEMEQRQVLPADQRRGLKAYAQK